MTSPQGPTSTPKLPPPPSPSTDAGIAPSKPEPQDESVSIPDAGNLDIFTLKPVAALKIFCDFLETLVRVTGDIPPTPTVSQSTTPRIEATGAAKGDETPSSSHEEKLHKRRSRQWAGDDGDVPHKARTPIGSPEARPTEPVHIEIVDAEIKPLVSQHLTVARKFYSKKPPPISLEDYLMRLHKYCPMSTGVYIATSLYIHRLAVVDRVIPVTPRNVHRLVLAALRVAMKALEDLSYPHSRFAKVGGVTEAELGKLEVSFCFVTNFELRVTSEMLFDHAKMTRDGVLTGLSKIPGGFQPKLPEMTKDLHAKIQSPVKTQSAVF